MSRSETWFRSSNILAISSLVLSLVLFKNVEFIKAVVLQFEHEKM